LHASVLSSCPVVPYLALKINQFV